MKHVNGPLRPPIEVDPSIPEGINAICVRLLAKSPGDRYTSDAELIEDLERVSEGLEPKEATTEMMTRAMAVVAPARGGPSRTGTTRITPPGDPRRKSKRRRVLPPAIILLVIVILALLAWAAYSLIQKPQEEKNTPPPIKVPDLAGLTVDEARDKLGKDFNISVEDEREGEQPVDTILEQDPGADERAEQGSDISVVVVGTQVAEVPNVRGDPRDEAKRALTDAGFTVRVDKEESDEQEGIVIAQDPSGGQAEVDSEVRITVSTGPPMVEVPGVVGNTPVQAAEILEGVNLELGSSSDTQPSDEVAEGSILFQTPEEGTEVEEGSSVDVTVSSGPEQVVVPNVYGLNVLEAQETLEAEGLIVSRNYTRVESQEPFDTALDTDPPVGTTVDEGTVVSLIASAGPATPPTTPTPEPESEDDTEPTPEPESEDDTEPTPEPESEDDAEPTPEPESEDDAEARQDAREARREAQQDAREEQQDAREEARKDEVGGDKGNKGKGKKN
jgi:serine/threonine-protein kinase